MYLRCCNFKIHFSGMIGRLSYKDVRVLREAANGYIQNFTQNSGHSMIPVIGTPPPSKGRFSNIFTVVCVAELRSVVAANAAVEVENTRSHAQGTSFFASGKKLACSRKIKACFTIFIHSVVVATLRIKNIVATHTLKFST